MIVPPLVLPRPSTTPAPSARAGNSTARGTVAPFVSSARRMLVRPEVGLQASATALGNLPAPWSGRSPTADLTEPWIPTRLEHAQDKACRPYQVGAWRNRTALQVALSTKDAATQLRRLEQALEGCRYDHVFRKQTEYATARAKELSRRFEVEATEIPASRPMSASSAAIKQSRGGAFDEREVEDENVAAEVPDLVDRDVEMEKAAVRIQAVHRGRQVRKQVMELSREQEDSKEDDLIFCNEVDEACTMRLTGGEEGYVEVQDDLGGGIGVFNGTYQLLAGENGQQAIVILLEKGSKLEASLDFNRMTYASLT